MGVDAQSRIGELRHVGLADDDESRPPQERNDICITRRCRLRVEHARGGTGSFAGNVEQVLD